jgi:hypothetical protein
VFAPDAPAAPLVVTPQGNVETLALRPQDVWKGLKAGAKIVLENGRYIVRVGDAILGPVGVAGDIYSLYQFGNWVNSQLPKIESNPPRTQYDFSTNQLLWQQPGGGWEPYPPPMQ